jgi:hypothetical protein
MYKYTDVDRRERTTGALKVHTSTSVFRNRIVCHPTITSTNADTFTSVLAFTMLEFPAAFPLICSNDIVMYGTTIAGDDSGIGQRRSI